MLISGKPYICKKYKYTESLARLEISHDIIYEPGYEKTGFLQMRNKDADQLRCILSSKFQVSSHRRSCTAWFVSDLVGNPEDRFSHIEAQLLCFYSILQTFSVAENQIVPIMMFYYPAQQESAPV